MNKISNNTFKFLGYDIVLPCFSPIVISPVTQNELKAKVCKTSIVAHLESAISKCVKIPRKNFCLLDNSNRQLGESENMIKEGCQIIVSPYDYRIRICPIIGNELEAKVCNTDTIERLVSAISKYLRISKEGFSLLFEDTPLKGGSLKENGITEECCIKLLISIEAGRSIRKLDNSTQEPLENLNDEFINIFLNGGKPLYILTESDECVTYVKVKLTKSKLDNTASSLHDDTQHQGLIVVSKDQNNAPCVDSRHNSRDFKISNKSVSHIWNLAQTLKQLSFEDFIKRRNLGIIIKKRISTTKAEIYDISFSNSLSSRLRSMTKNRHINASLIISSLAQLLIAEPRNTELHKYRNTEQNKSTRKTFEKLRKAIEKQRKKRNKRINIRESPYSF